MNPDFVDLLRAFIAHDVRFLIIDAYALAVHGKPRATGDLDVWIDATVENAPRVMRALSDFGAPLAKRLPRRLQPPGCRPAIGTSAAPHRRADRIERHYVCGIVARPPATALRPPDVDYLGREAFIRNKRATGRGTWPTSKRWSECAEGTLPPRAHHGRNQSHCQPAASVWKSVPVRTTTPVL